MNKQSTKKGGFDLSLDGKRKFYKSLVTMTFSEAGRTIGMSEHYSTPSSLRSAAYKIYKDLDPKELNIDNDVVEMVNAAIEARKVTPNRNLTEVNNTELLDTSDIKAVVSGARDKAALILHKKLDYLSRNKKALEQVNLSQLGTLFGIMFDKSQILHGQATENIAMVSKIESDLSPEQLLALTLKQREATIEDKQ